MSALLVVGTVPAAHGRTGRPSAAPTLSAGVEGETVNIKNQDL